MREPSRILGLPLVSPPNGDILEQRMSSTNPEFGAPGGHLSLGPGSRLASLEPILGALGAASVAHLSDLGALLGPQGEDQRVLVDLQSLPTEDAGILRRWLQQNPSCILELVGGDPTRAVAQSLTLQANAHWNPWPLDTERLALWARGQGQGNMASSAPLAPSAQPHENTAPRLQDPELRAIEKILGDMSNDEGTEALTPFDIQTNPTAPPARERPAPQHLDPGPSPAPDPGAFGAGLDPEPDPSPDPVIQPNTSQLITTELPSWYRDQVADLADMAQRLDLGLRRTLEASEEAESDNALRGLSEDIMRLGQFTRTIGYLAAPPGPDGSTVDLSGLAQDFLSSLAHEEDGGPRYLFRAAPDAIVRAEKGLLVLAIDAILAVASLATGSNGEVKVGVSKEGPTATLEVTFPAGPLARLEAPRWLEPYALHRLLPGIGPNAIPAAAAILTGQGGELTMAFEEKERTFRVTLPCA